MQENAKVIKRRPNFFVRDPFNSVCFSEDPARNALRKRALFLSRRPTVLELKGGRADGLTLTESTDISANMHEVMQHSSRRRNGHFVEAG